MLIFDRLMLNNKSYVGYNDALNRHDEFTSCKINSCFKDFNQKLL